jgi:O-antigen ligase
MPGWREKLSPYLIGTVCLAYAGLYFDLSVSNIAIFLLLGLCLVTFTLRSFYESIKSNSAIQLLILFYLLHVIGLISTENFDNGLFILEKKVALLVMPLFLFPALQRLTAVQKSELIIWLGLITIGSSVIFLSSALMKTVSCHDPMAFHHEHFASIPYVFYSIYFAVGSLLLLHAAYTEISHSKTRTLIFIALIIYSLTLLVLISSKTGIIAYVAGLIYLLYRNIKSKKIFGLCMMGVIISLAILLASHPSTLNRFSELTRNINLIQADSVSQTEVFTGLNLRIFFWKASIIQLWNDQHIFTGIGTGDAQDFLDLAYAKVKLDYFGYQGFDAHNQWIMTILQLGLVGVGLLAAVFIAGWRAASKRSNLYFHFFALVVLFFSFSESLLESNKGIVFFAIFFCVLAGDGKELFKKS